MKGVESQGSGAAADEVDYMDTAFISAPANTQKVKLTRCRPGREQTDAPVRTATTTATALPSVNPAVASDPNDPLAPLPSGKRRGWTFGKPATALSSAGGAASAAGGAGDAATASAGASSEDMGGDSSSSGTAAAASDLPSAEPAVPGMGAGTLAPPGTTEVAVPAGAGPGAGGVVMDAASAQAWATYYASQFGYDGVNNQYEFFAQWFAADPKSYSAYYHHFGNGSGGMGGAPGT